MGKVRWAGVSSGEDGGVPSMLFSCPFAGTNRIRFKGLDGLTHPLSLADEGTPRNMCSSLAEKGPFVQVQGSLVKMPISANIKPMRFVLFIMGVLCP